MSLSDVPFVYTDLQNAFEKMHSAIKENDLYAKVTRWELLLVLSGVVEIHFLIYLGFNKYNYILLNNVVKLHFIES